MNLCRYVADYEMFCQHLRDIRYKCPLEHAIKNLHTSNLIHVYLDTLKN